MSNGVKRINPRRPVRVTSEGVRRIVLGEIGDAAADIQPGTAKASAGPKPLRTEQSPKRWILAIAHADRGRLDDHASQALAAAAILASPETGVAAAILGDVTEDLGTLGADLIVCLSEFNNALFQPEREVAAIIALIEHLNAAHVFMPDNATGTGDLGRRLMVHFGEAAGTRIAELTVDRASIRWLGGATLASISLPRFILLEPGIVDTTLPFRGRGEMMAPDARPLPQEITPVYRDLGLEKLDASFIALEEADVIVAAGNGAKNVATIEALAKALGAAVGASRVAVDEGKFPREKQIGATGKTVSASAYVAVGISGAVQHLQGIKDCRYVIAINKDASAPIVKRADLTLVGDAEELMQAVLTRLEHAKRQSPEAP